jgi:dTDP-glucose 4,6-dehydratase
MKNILVTGGAGFIGSNFVRHVLTNYPRCSVINLDALTYAGNLENLSDIDDNGQHSFIKGDIRDFPLLESIFRDYAIDTVVNFAAETHVDRSIEDPSAFLDVNIRGTQALLDVALHAWRAGANDKYCRDYLAGTRFLQVSTDEVYGTLKPHDPAFRETNPLMPNSPYAASKAGADLLVRAYHETYGLPVNITRCSNNYGPYQFPEKLIPLMINNAIHDSKLPVYGDGKQVRDWLFVEDHCLALMTVLRRGELGEVYNIGGNNEQENIFIVNQVLEALGKPSELIAYVKDRPGHDRRYAIDNTRISTELGWKPQHSFEDGLRETIRWYLDNASWMNDVTSGAYRDYYAAMYDEETCCATEIPTLR